MKSATAVKRFLSVLTKRKEQDDISLELETGVNGINPNPSKATNWFFTLV